MRKFSGIVAVIVFIAGVAFLSAGDVQASEPIEGFWKSVDEEGKSTAYWKFMISGGVLYGKIIRVPGQEDSVRCTECDGNFKNARVIGTNWLKLTRNRDGVWDQGTITDPEDGKTYEARVWVENGDLRLRGYVGPFYRTQTWKRARDPR